MEVKESKVFDFTVKVEARTYTFSITETSEERAREVLKKELTAVLAQL